ncbi:phage tail tape measure protein [Aeromicrobium sp. 9AM]|uniref:phage tail tape measure protein n=1 Tax=Aeromicrobium sp. 9AM TaxID=2653126 RepID=UPI0012F39237|nr:phage tail tape measure protein [Aeromicrobium sp. 9AM]VXC08962.1 Tail protein [Aeromicrobium sp. 9AM]
MTNRIVKIVLRGDVSNLVAGLKVASTATADAANRMTGASKEATKYRASLSSVGSVAGKVGLVAAAGLGAIVVATARFDKAMSAVQAATHESASSMETLRAAAIKAGADTVYSASEAAGAIEELAKAGVSTKDILAGGLSGSLNLAAAGAIEVGDAAEIAATAMTQFSLGGDKVTHIADLLAAGAGKAQGGVDDLGMALKQSGLVASQTGLTIEETTGTLAAFASAGLIGSDAGTSFKTMLQSLTPTGAKAASEMDRLGITAYDAQGNFVGMTKFADSLKNGLKDLSVEQQNAAMKTIFGSDAVRAASVVFAQGGSGIQSWIDKVDESGYAAETAATRLDNLSGDLEQFKGSLETALIGAGEDSQGGLRDLVQGATNAVNVFNNLPGPVRSSTVALLGITAILGGGLWFTAKTIAGVAAMRANLVALGPAGARAAAGMRAAGVAAAAFAAIDIGTSLAESLDDRSTGEIDKLGKSLQSLAKSGKATGDLADLFGDDLHGKSVRFGKDMGGIGDALKSFSDLSDDGGLTETFTWLKGGGPVGNKGGLYAQVDAIKDMDSALSRLSKNDPEAAAKAFSELSKRAKDTGASAADISAAFPSMTAAMDSAGDASKQTADEITALGGEADSAAGDVKKLNDALDGLLDPLLGQDAAMSAWKESISTLSGELRKNGNTLDSNTHKGRENRNAIRDRVEALKASVQADGEAGATAGEMSAKMLRGAAGILRAGEAAGISRGKMKSYLATLGLTPSQIKTVIQAETGDALNKVRNLQQFINGMHGKTVKIHIEGGTPGGITKASGGIVDYYANGGIRENHIAQIAPAGSMRVWAEPETGGEAYIPFASSKRKRSQEIALETVSRLGGVAAFADGGTHGVGGSSGAMSLSLVGARVSIDKNGIGTFVDGRIEAAISGQENFTAGQRRAGSR